MKKSNPNILHRENIELVNGTFIPFLEEKKIIEEEIAHHQEEQNHIKELDGEIKELQDKIESLNQTKLQIENEILEKEKQLQDSQEKQAQEIEKNKQEAEAIIEEAKNHAETIIQEANQNKEKIEDEANQIREKIINESKETGYQEGYTQGYAKGEKDQEEIEIFLRKILNQAVQKKDEIIESIRHHLVEIVYAAVKKVVKQISEEDRKVVLKNIVHALKKIDDPVRLKIKVSYDDLKASQAFKKQILNSFKKLKQVEVEGDPNIEPGGCMVETDFTVVDARISSQLEKISLVLGSLDSIKTTRS